MHAGDKTANMVGSIRKGVHQYDARKSALAGQISGAENHVEMPVRPGCGQSK